MRLHPHVANPRHDESWDVRVADRVAGAFGTMSMFWVLVCWQLGWMILATMGVWVFRDDRYPFVFCLFLSNLIQLWALPILGTATNRADQKRAAKADADHQALTYIATTLDSVAASVRSIAADRGTEGVR